MNHQRNAISVLMLFLAIITLGCKDTKEPRNEAEIVERNIDTFFNSIPGNDIQGSYVGNEASVMISDDISEVLALSGLSVASQALDSTGLTDELKEKTSITFFAPIDAAFHQFKNTHKLNSAELQNLLLDHTVEGIVKTEDLTDGMKLKTLSGKTLTVSIQDNKLLVNNATIVDTNFAMQNGIIHKINQVIQVE